MRNSVKLLFYAIIGWLLSISDIIFDEPVLSSNSKGKKREKRKLQFKRKQEEKSFSIFKGNRKRNKSSLLYF